MNNTCADLYHDLVCEHQKLSDKHSKLRLKLTQKGKLSRHTIICRNILFLFTSQYTCCRHITFHRHFLATAEEQVTELLKRVKELTGMPNPANLQLSLLYFKSFNPLIVLYLHILFYSSSLKSFLTSNPCR
jgi:hypothetical protein